MHGVKGATEIIDYFRNWARSYNAWVTMIDHQGKPNASSFHNCDPSTTVAAAESESERTSGAVESIAERGVPVENDPVR